MRVQQRTVLNAVLSFMFTSVAATVSAGDHDHHDAADGGSIQGSLSAHEHSAAKVGVVQEGTRLVFEFESPAYDIVGFEHAANTGAEKQKIRKEVDALARSSQLLEINAEARCKLEHTEISSPLSEVDEHEHHEEHDKHDEEHASETHSEFHVSYQFHCEKPADLKDLRLTAFTHYVSLKEIEAVWVTEQGQGSAELSPRQPVISLVGSF